MRADRFTTGSAVAISPPTWPPASRSCPRGAVVVAAADDDLARGEAAAWRDRRVVDEAFDQPERDLAGRRRGLRDAHHVVADELDDAAGVQRGLVVRGLLTRWRSGGIKAPELRANFAWGDDDGRTLYMTARTGLYRIRLKVPGIRP